MTTTQIVPIVATIAIGINAGGVTSGLVLDPADHVIEEERRQIAQSVDLREAGRRGSGAEPLG